MFVHRRQIGYEILHLTCRDPANQYGGTDHIGRASFTFGAFGHGCNMAADRSACNAINFPDFNARNSHGRVRYDNSRNFARSVSGFR